MEFLKIKRRSNRAAELYWVKSREKYDKNRDEIYLTKRKNYVITGDADSGKTRILKRLFADADKIWKGYKVVYLSGVDPISSWVDGAEGENQHQKIENFIATLAEARSVVLFDDAHKLTGRKLQIAKRILLAATRYWITTVSHTRIPPTIRAMTDDRHCIYIDLKSEVAFDATIAAVLVLVVAGVAMGHPEFAIMGGIAGLLAGGRLSSSNKT